MTDQDVERFAAVIHQQLDDGGDVCDACRQTVKKQLAPLVDEITQREVAGVREQLWLHHGCPMPALYGDGGEMQCGNCKVDFKRHAIAVIMRGICQARNSTCGHPLAEREDRRNGERRDMDEEVCIQEFLDRETKEGEGGERRQYIVERNPLRLVWPDRRTHDAGGYCRGCERERIKVSEAFGSLFFSSGARLSRDTTVATIKEELRQAEARGRLAGMAEASNIAGVWANSDSCSHHDNSPCCHVRTGKGIVEEIRKRISELKAAKAPAEPAAPPAASSAPSADSATK